MTLLTQEYPRTPDSRKERRNPPQAHFRENPQVPTLSTNPTSKITGEAIRETYRTMRDVDHRIRERTPSQCLLPRNDGNGRAVVDCVRDTQLSHTIQEAVLRRIANGNPPKVIMFVPIDSQMLANAGKADDGSLWGTLPWDLASLR